MARAWEIKEPLHEQEAGAAENAPVLEDSAPRRQIPETMKGGAVLERRLSDYSGRPEPHPRHASILAKLEPQMQRIVWMMMMETVEGVWSIEKGEGVDMD